MAFIAGCQQQVKPPVTEIPRAEISQSDAPQTSETTETSLEPTIPKQIDWNRRSQEITRTELSPNTPQIPQSNRREPNIVRQSDTTPAFTSVIPESSMPERSGVTPLNVMPSIQPIDETPAISAQIESNRSIEAGEPGLATSVVIDTSPQAVPVPKNLIEAASEQLFQNEPELAILSINAIDPKSLSKKQRAEVLRMKSDAYRQLDMSIAALRFDAERLRYLEDDAANATSRRILGELEGLPARLLQDLSVGTDLLAGMAHALLLKKAPSDDGIQQWLRKYRMHPLLKANLNDYDFLTSVEPPKDFDVTVLLPLSGDLGNAGRAIRDGMLFEYQRQQSQLGVALRIIDTAKLSHDEMVAIGQSSESEFIVGPLRKEKAIALLESKPQMPVLVLNRIKTDSMDLDSPAYSLSLAIEDDAESVVNQIAQQADHPRVVLFHADSPLGIRAAEAIGEQLTFVGGSSAGKFALDTKKPEIAITQAFGVNDSQNRRRELSKTLGLRLEHTPRIRQDMTGVVVQTDPKKAQQIRPLLDFYYLDQTPVYLIGAYRPDLADVAEDLRNSQLLVTPWDLGTDEKQVLLGRTNAQGVFGSLVGVGIDAMRMTMQLGFGGTTSIQGQTGYLTLGPDSMIHRQLSTISITNNQQVIARPWEPLPSLLQSESLNAE